MPITLDISGKNMKIKVLRGLDFEELRDKVKLLSGKKPMYNLIDGQSKFDYWEVPVSQFGNLLSHVPKERILLQSEAAKALMSKYSMDTAGLLELPPITKEIKWKRPPRFPEQEQYIRINEAKQKMVLAPAPGLGKAQPLYSKLLTPDGFITMGEVKIGTTLVGAKGLPVQVTNVWPQGIRPIYRITFSDRTFVDCDENHLWVIETKNGRRKKVVPKVVLSTKQILDLGPKTPCGDRKYYIPMTKPVQFKKRDLPINPYLLGMLLGDGGLSSTHVNLTSIDEQVVDTVGDIVSPLGLRLVKEKESSDGKRRYTYRIIKTVKDGRPGKKDNVLVSEMRKLGLLPIACHHRFIPDIYKYGSIEDRLEVLRGLMDADGHVSSTSNNTEVTFKSLTLLNDLCELVESLGGNTYKSKKLVNGVYYYRANLVLEFNPFKLYRKSQTWKPPTKYLPYRVIDSIEYIGEQVAQCITVDAEDSLYLTDNYTPTHNSGMSIMRAQVLGATRVLVVGPSKSNYTTWRAEVDKSTDWTTIEYHGTTAKRKKIRESENFLQANVVYTTYTMAHELVGFPFEQVICDEAHTICHSNTKLFKNIKKLMKSLPDAGLQLLSGTPIQHKPQDYWALTHLVNEMIAGDEAAWQRMYEKVEKTIIRKVPVKTANGYALDEHGRVKLRRIEIPTKTSPQNIDHLSGRIKPFTFRLKRDNFVNFEDRTDIQLVGMLPRQLEMYRQAKEDLYLELSTGQLKLSKEAFGRLTRFLQICEGCFNLDENVQDSGKFEYLYSQLDAAKDKRIVWGRFKPGSHILYKKYQDRASIYNGDFTQIQKNVALWNFQGCETKQDLEDWKKYNKTKFTEPGQADFLFATIDRGCTAGLNLDKCSKQYFTSFSWAGNINDQTSARVKRLNQLAEEVYTEFIITEGWEENALALTFRNLAVTLDILDGKSDISYQQIQSLINKL